MKITKEYQTITTRRTHEFYCDDCGILIGETYELEDGYYPILGKYERKYYSPRDGWISLTKCLCDSCAAKMDIKINNQLTILGFRKEKEYE